ncbi:unannotated protein [freshwater metagenome]|uniref:Unannotated protein n=1 Tax=freshwater metagenome TaxID=449393 RepID=A0A6J7SFJ2_9ZZZZ
MTAFNIYPGDHVSSEVDDLLKILRCKIQEVAKATWYTLEVPDVSNRSSKLDVTHALTANLGASYLNTTALADDALESHALVLAAVALPVASRSEDLLAEQAVFLWLESAVVNCFWLLYFTV